MIDISSLLNKQDNAEQQQYIEEQGIPAEQTLPAEEFVNKIVRPIQELQEADAHNVKKIVRGAQVFEPVDGVLTFPSTEASVGITAQESTTSYVVTSGPVTFHLRCVSTDNGADTGNLLNVIVERYANGAYSTVYETQIQSVPAASSSWYELVLPDDALPDGASQVRISAQDPETLALGRLAFQSVVKATLSVEPTFQWYVPITDIAGGIPISYAIGGTGVSKTMHVRIYDNQGSNYRDLEYVIGTGTFPRTNAWSPSTNPNDTSTDLVKIMTHGVHMIEAWVSCVADGVTRESPHIKNQVMVVADTSDTTLHLMVQQVQTEVDNYVQVNPMFQFAVYKKGNTSDGTKVAFTISDYEGTSLYMSTEVMARNSTQYSEPATVEIEGASVGVDTYAYFHATDEYGNNLLVGGSSIILTVHNQYNFSPVIGADLYINPSSRNNGEANPARILNAARGNAVVGSTFSGLSFDANDGWVLADDGRRVLRLLAGQSLSIQYNPFEEYATNYQANVTIELDVKISNITNEADPIVDISNALAGTVGKFTGLKLKPLEGIVMTASQTVDGQQNFGIREGVRTHIAINICSAIYVDSSQLTIPLVRVFVNANPYREFMFALEQYEWGRSTYTIDIGQTGADIDIYGLRVYRRALSAQDVMQNYKSSLPTSAEKLAFATANDILGGDGTISYELAREKYSCIVHHGTPTSIQHPDSTTCWIHIDHLVNGVYDPATSGDICRETGSLPNKGQGSTAKTYADWNQQYDVKKAKGKITVDGVEVADGWIDGNGNYKGQYYYLSTSDAKWQKLVGKINYASSMQSHKMGATNAYNDLYRALMGNSLDTIMANDSKTRCTVKEDIFLFFVQEEGEATPHYEGLMTFGSGKMDKKCWGYDDAVYPDFAMFEGSDNDQPVTNFERPWNDDVTYNVEEEYFEYNGNGNIDFDAGATDGDDVPIGAAVTAMRNFINFGYLHCTDILPWTTNGGTATSLIAAAGSANIHKQYWVTIQDSLANVGDLYSWSPLDGAWINARISPTDLPRNIFTENPGVTMSGDYAADNEALIASIVARFKANSASYYNVRSKLFHSCFVENLIAGSDNCAKNTYYVVDPVTHKINFHADDLDTIFKTDNVGWQTKPYYVDRVYHIDEDGNECYSGTHNMFFNTFDLAYEAEKQQMMKDIFTAMASISGSVDDFFEDYFFSIQRGIPCIAYLEQAKVRYEKRQIQKNQGIIVTPIAPISQQLGSQLESELQYMERRLVYFKSYAAYGEFGGEGGNTFMFRGTAKRNGTAARIAFTVKPHQYIFPTTAYGQTVKIYKQYPDDGSKYYNPRIRLSPGDSFEALVEEQCSSDTTIKLFGIDYYTEIGNLGDISYNPAYDITISGKRLTKIEAIPTSGLGEFRPSAITVAASLVEEVSIKCADVGSNLNLTGLTRLRKVDLRNSSINVCRLPETQTLMEVRFGSYMTDVRIAGMPNLATFSMQGYSSLQEIYVGAGNGNFDSLSFAQAVYAAEPSGLVSVSFLGVTWGGSGNNAPAPAMVMWFANRQSCVLTGSMNCPSTLGTFTFADKQQLAAQFGNIDSNANPLYILYNTIQIQEVGIYGEKYIHQDICHKISSNPDIYEYDGLSVSPLAVMQNDVKIIGNRLDIEWSIETNQYATIDSQTGVLTITEFSPQLQYQNYQVTAKVRRLSDNVQVTVSRVIGFYRRIPRLGDFAYLDGSFDDVYDVTKDLAGVVYARMWYKYNPDTVTENNAPLRYVLSSGAYVIDPEAAYMRVYIVSKEFMQATYDEVLPVNLDMEWGLYNDESNTDNGFPAESLAAMLQVINNTYNTQYTSVFDLAGLTNRGTHGFPTQYAYRDYVQAATGAADFYEYGGFDKNYVLEKDSPLNRNYALADWDGRKNTEEIVSYANKILGAYVNTQVSEQVNQPTTLAELARYMRKTLYTDLAPAGNTSTKYYQFAYPAAYACKLYEPTHRTGATIDPQYAKGMWYLPAFGELVRMFHHFNISRDNPRDTTHTGDNSAVPNKSHYNYDVTEGQTGVDAWNPIFAKTLKRLDDAGALSDNVFRNLTASFYRSSTEGSAIYAWNVNFSSGNVGYNSKYNRHRVRAVTAYLFNIL